MAFLARSEFERDATKDLVQKIAIAANAIGLKGEKITKVYIQHDVEAQGQQISFQTITADLATLHDLEDKISELEKHKATVKNRIDAAENVGVHIERIS